MDLAYVDESGNTGLPPQGTQTFTLGCVIVGDTDWPRVFDALLDYRRFLRARFGLPVRAEIKANYLLRNGGAFRPLKLSEPARFAIYRGLMRLQGKLGLKSFAVVMKKTAQVPYDARDAAWTYLLQRLERHSTVANVPVLLVHDEGEGDLIRKLFRKARRAGAAPSRLGTGLLRRPGQLFIDDPVVRRSHESYMIQLADLNAYAAFRALFPPRVGRGIVVPQTMWDELGAARNRAVNRYSRRGNDPIGVVVGP